VVPHPAVLDASPIKAELLQGVDIMVVRELTGGIYFGDKQSHRDRSRRRVPLHTVVEIERVVRLAAKLAQARRRRLTSVDKANCPRKPSRLWRSVVDRILPAEFPEVKFEHMLVDSAAMHLIRRPLDFDVIVTENMFGDILTDEASMLAGSLGLLPSALAGSRRPRRPCSNPSMVPRRTSPAAAIANPYATILSAAMLLRYSLKLEAEARGIGKRRLRGRRRRRPARRSRQARRQAGVDAGRGRCGPGRIFRLLAPLNDAHWRPRAAPARLRQRAAPARGRQPDPQPDRPDPRSPPTPAAAPGPIPARRRAVFVHAGMRHAGRVCDQAFDAAQRFGQGEALQPLEERLHRRPRRRSTRSSAWRRIRFGCCFARSVARMAGKSGVVHLPYGGVTIQGLHDGHRILLMHPSSRMQGGATGPRSVMKLSKGRAGDSDGVRPPGQVLRQFSGGRNHRAADHVAVDRFRYLVVECMDQVRSQSQRLLPHG